MILKVPVMAMFPGDRVRCAWGPLSGWQQQWNPCSLGSGLKANDGQHFSLLFPQTIFMHSFVLLGLKACHLFCTKKCISETSFCKNVSWRQTCAFCNLTFFFFVAEKWFFLFLYKIVFFILVQKCDFSFCHRKVLFLFGTENKRVIGSVSQGNDCA